MENRSESRKKIMTILYQMSVYDKNKMKYEIEDVIKEVSEFDSEFIKEIVYGVVTYKNDIDALANKYLNNLYGEYYIDPIAYPVIVETE